MQIRILNENPILDYKQFCMITQGKIISKCSIPENEVDWWIKQIVANHSTLRCIHFRIIREDPKNSVMQLIRATKGHPQPEVCSSRPDWTGIERSNNPYEDKLYAMDHTPESFIEMAKQRLCTRTEANTRKVMQKIVNEMKNSSTPLIQAIGYCSLPACGWLVGCPEIKSCGLYCSKAQFIINQKNIN